MKSVMTLSVLLVAASMAAASVHITLDPAVDYTGAQTRDGLPVKAVLVRATVDPGEVITAIEIGFYGPILQSWTYAEDEDTGLPVIGKTPSAGKQTGIVRDSRFIMNVTAPSDWAAGIPSNDPLHPDPLDPLHWTRWPGAILPGSDKIAEDLNGGVVYGAYLYGKGTFLGSLAGTAAAGMPYGISSDPTVIEIAQILVDATDYANGGVRLIADGAAKNLGTGATNNAHFDMIIGFPEPVSIVLLAIGGVAAISRRRRA